MYQDELFREAGLISQGHQAFVRDVAAFFARLKVWISAPGHAKF